MESYLFARTFEKPAPLCYSRSGYGNRLPTSHCIRIGRRWYRVYAICYSNTSIFYIRWGGKRHIVDFYDDYDETGLAVIGKPF